MKRFLAILLLTPLLLGQMAIENKFTVTLDQWLGLDSDETISRSLIGAQDLFNMEVGNEGGQTYIQQRKGMRRVLGGLPISGGNEDEVRAFTFCQINGDTERAVVYYSDYEVYQTTGDGTWHDIFAGGSASDTVTNFLLFKDTLMASIKDSVFKWVVNDSASQFLQVWPADYPSDADMNLNMMFLHNDRVYRWGTHADNNWLLAWNPEFDINFNKAHVDSQVALGFSGELSVAQGDGDFLTNVLPFADGHIMAYKSRSIYKVVIDPLTNAPTQVIEFAKGTGAYGYGAAVRWDNRHYFIGENGVYENNGSSFTKISGPIDYWFADSLPHSQGASRIFKLEVYDNKLFCSLPKRRTGAGQESQVSGFRTFVYDFDTGTWAKWRLATSDGLITSQYGHWLVRYEHNPFSADALFGNSGKYLKQRLFVVSDTNNALPDDKMWIYPDVNYLSDGGTVSPSYYETPLSPIGTMWQRKQIERIVVYGEATVSAGDSAVSTVVHINTEDGAQDSVYLSITSSPFLISKRLNVAGDLIGLRFDFWDSNTVKINAVNLVGTLKGLGKQ